jgi:hypothetical protein
MDALTVPAKIHEGLRLCWGTPFAGEQKAVVDRLLAILLEDLSVKVCLFLTKYDAYTTERGESRDALPLRMSWS